MEELTGKWTQNIQATIGDSNQLAVGSAGQMKVGVHHMGLALTYNLRRLAAFHNIDRFQKSDIR